jgi:Malectin domain
LRGEDVKEVVASSMGRIQMTSYLAPSREEERAELDAVVEALAKSPRLSKLLHYMGEKYFRGETEQLQEYYLATEVFGRSKDAFDAAEDAIARVESHRLRKKLKDFYETEGKDHPVRLSIPSGTYVPVFTYRAGEVSPPLPLGPLEAEQPPVALPAASAKSTWKDFGKATSSRIFVHLRRPGWFHLVLIAASGLAAMGIYKLSHLAQGQRTVASESMIAPRPVSAAPFAPLSTRASLPIRLMAGYAGKPQTDSAGDTWDADKYFVHGGIWTRPQTFIARTSDPLLFEHWRTGDFFYNIPLQPGSYELHLYFSTWQRADEAFSTFSVQINGDMVLRAFDVNSDAFGENIADERVFRDVSPAKDGMLHIAFTSERGAPALNAIEVLPGIPNKQLPIHITTQLTSFTDHTGQVWHPDTYFMSGRLSEQRQQIASSPDPDLFGNERYGHFTYAIPVDTRDRFTLALYFVESYFGPNASGAGGAGDRVFRVICNGETLLDNFDIYKEVGALHVLTKTFHHLKPTAQGKLNLTFEPIVNNATVSGIEVLDESQ